MLRQMRKGAGMMPLKDILKGGVSAIYARELREAAADVAAKLAISLEAIETFKRTGALCDVVTYLIAAERADAAFEVERRILDHAKVHAAAIDDGAMDNIDAFIGDVGP